MGPLVPDIISNEFNFIIAIIVGMGFGFALEQAGFGSTRKLVGLFYGYDFTVLKVFFTAGVTAMVGITALNHLQLLDVDIIFINPTFLWAAIIGGVIMGAGFIIGGFCPGTSVVAAASGKIDGWAFVFGAGLGIFAFVESYPLVKDLMVAENLGYLLVFEMMGISREAFALMMIFVATGAFIGVTFIENKVNNRTTQWLKKDISKYSIAVGLAVITVLLTIITPSRGELMNKRIDAKLAAGECKPQMMADDKLAYELMNQYYLYNVVDVRSPEEFKKFHIPTAINIPLEELHKHDNINRIVQNIKTNVFYGASYEQAQRACLVSKYHGKADNYALNSTADQFQQNFFMLGDEQPKNKMDHETYVFRKEAAQKLIEIGEAVANLDKPVVKKTKRVQGGCS
ncbi:MULTISPECIES: YeeE/YedE thiosulfate transporter family protein [unclassified Carboxylicivirga]|uniref:YeeE/YedE thiosulfate transporter family protein n=1 Tax=Carboxylicivirga TaxID=1628153 RepID=UPI003D33AFEF